MTNAKNLGIWLDHSHAHLMEFTTDPIETTTITSKFTHDEKAESREKSENLMHNKEQHEQASFYKTLAEQIRKYESVILFGPTTAKNELANLLKADHHYDDVKVTVAHADKMTDNQMHAFVKEHFSSKHLF